MKLLKYTLLFIGILGLIATTYNMIYNQSFIEYKQELFYGVLFIFVSFNLNEIINGIKNFKFPQS
ncbi:hypothetical protein [Psychroserpens sp. MEBiC05023]